jgi:hypothetical protein
MEIPVNISVAGRWLGKPSISVAIELALERLLEGLGAVVYVCPSGVGCYVDGSSLTADIEIRRGPALLRGTVYGVCAGRDSDWLDCRLHRIELYL